MAFLEDYTLLDELGQGGYATVYKVRHNKLEYIRAIRVLNEVIARGEEDPKYQKFLNECKLLLRLGNGNHPNIVHIYRPLLKDQRALVEMDFVDGKDLFHYLEEKHSFIEYKDVLRLLTDIGSALAYCHEDIYKFCMDKNKDNLKDDPNDGSKVLLDEKTKKKLIKDYRVIHNDIHSGNIIRREDGSYVLLDFGLAIVNDKVSRASQIQGGVPEFKSPEKWDNEEILTPQSDIYSFGVVLYEYLAGRVPFLFDKKNSNSTEAKYLLSKAHKEQQPQSVFELRKASFEATHPNESYEQDYPDWMEELVMKCLAKKAEDRFKNGKELYTFVLEHIGDETDAQLQKKINDLETDLNNERERQHHLRKTLNRSKVLSIIFMVISFLLLFIIGPMVSDNEKTITSLNKEIDELKKQINNNSTGENVENLNSQLRNNEKTITSLNKEIDKLKKQIKDKDKEISALIESLDKIIQN